jgi:hypothetical protein
MVWRCRVGFRLQLVASRQEVIAPVSKSNCRLDHINTFDLFLNICYLYVPPFSRRRLRASVI